MLLGEVEDITLEAKWRLKASKSDLLSTTMHYNGLLCTAQQTILNWVEINWTFRNLFPEGFLWKGMCWRALPFLDSSSDGFLILLSSHSVCTYMLYSLHFVIIWCGFECLWQLLHGLNRIFAYLSSHSGCVYFNHYFAVYLYDNPMFNVFFFS